MYSFFLSIISIIVCCHLGMLNGRFQTAVCVCSACDSYCDHRFHRWSPSPPWNSDPAGLRCKFNQHSRWNRCRRPFSHLEKRSLIKKSEAWKGWSVLEVCTSLILLDSLQATRKAELTSFACPSGPHTEHNTSLRVAQRCLCCAFKVTSVDAETSVVESETERGMEI